MLQAISPFISYRPVCLQYYFYEAGEWVNSLFIILPYLY
jgi:hypothetical protein